MYKPNIFGVILDDFIIILQQHHILMLNKEEASNKVHIDFINSDYENMESPHDMNHDILLFNSSWMKYCLWHC